MEIIPYVDVSTIANAAKPIIKYKASEGLLKELIPVFVDVETFMDKAAGVSLSSQTLRQYIKSSYLTSIGIAIGDDDPEVVLTPGGVFSPEDSYIVDALRALALSDKHIFVCHNAAFDIRVIRFMLGIVQPRFVWCTMEGAMAAWPEFPGGYGLFNLGDGLDFPSHERKLEIDLDAGKYTLAELKIYNGRDVICARTLYYRQIARLPWQEQRIAILTHNVRKFHFLVDSERLDALVVTLDANAKTAEMAAKLVTMNTSDADARPLLGTEETDIGADGLIILDDAQICEVFNREDADNPGMLKSVRGARLIKIIREKYGITLPTTSLKKLSPVWQAQHPKITDLLRQTTRANKMISHGRRSKNLQNVPEVDVELGYFRAHTGRFSSPSQGKGLNLHNCVSSSSQILTARGFVPILHLLKDDLLWDGTEFVPFACISYEGERTTGRVGLAEITPEHPVWDGTQMTPAGELTHSQQVRVVAAGFSSMLQAVHVTACYANASDVVNKLREWFSTSQLLLVAAAAQIDDEQLYTILESLLKNFSSFADDTTTCAIECTGPDTPLTHCSSRAATEQGSATSGEGVYEPSVFIASRFLAGMIRLSSWIEQTTLLDTNQETFALLVVEIMAATAVILSEPKHAKPSSTVVGDSVLNMPPGTTVSERAVFDIRGVGSRARFWCSGIISSNCPKHDISIAKPVRQVFRLPPDKCFVRGDLANVEYRVEGWLTDCPSVYQMFDEVLGGSRFADPYIKGWQAMTQQIITKKSPVRQVSKSATLGLGFLMSSFGYAKVLLVVCSDPQSKVTEAGLALMIKELQWPMPSEKSMKLIVEKTGCSTAIAIASWNIHRLFNAAHPEFAEVGDWLVRCITRVAEVGCGRGIGNLDRFVQAERILREMETVVVAPNPLKLRLTIDDDYSAKIPSVRVQCGPWPSTVCWREPAVRTNKMTNQGKPQLTILKANGLDKPFTRQLAIENVTQAAARNALCHGLLQLEDRYGTRDVLHVHDEVLIITDRKREAVLAAKEQLTNVLGPKAGHPLDWAILIKPSEISITQSLWEEEYDIMHEFNEEKQKWIGNDRWGKIERGELDMFENLP